MNSLLKRQIDKKLKGGLNDLDLFLVAINESYENFEDQIGLLQRAMKISSDELFAANQKLRDEAESLKEVNRNLEFILKSMSLDGIIASKMDSFDSSEYIKQQSIEIVKINKQREELLLDLEKQNKALNEYAHMVSHDLKAPLRSIDTLINWFVEDNKDMMNETNMKPLNLILSNVEKMDLLIKGILNYSAVENIDNQDRVIDLNILIDKILNVMPLSEQVVITLKNPLPKVFGNDFRYKQLFQNLIQNAIKYNDKDKISVEIGNTENDTEFQFYIKDNGVGIPEKYHTKVFDIFSLSDDFEIARSFQIGITRKGNY